MKGNRHGHRRADQKTNRYPETHSFDRALTPAEAYGAIIALEDARESARAAGRAKERDRKDGMKNATIIHGEVIGWRIWEYDRPSGLLKSWAQDTLWVPGTPVFADGSIGVHAFKSRQRAMSEALSILVVGSVRLWGTVIEHEHGYRAEFAEVNSIESAPRWALDKSVCIFFDLKSLRFRRRLRDLYGV